MDYHFAEADYSTTSMLLGTSMLATWTRELIELRSTLATHSWRVWLGYSDGNCSMYNRWTHLSRRCSWIRTGNLLHFATGLG